VVEEGGRLLGVVEESRALRDAHPGAVYLHQGDTFISRRLDWERGEVVVAPADVDYYTQPKVETDLEVLAVVEEATMGLARWHLGEVQVHSQVIGYQRRALHSREVLETTWLDLPSTTYTTMATWMSIPAEVAAAVPRHRLPGALHAAEHAAIALLPLRAVCDRWDIGGLSAPWHPASAGPAIFVYEAYPGGAGISEIAFGAGLDHWRETREMIGACPCRGGCPSCIQSPKCGNLNEPLDKEGAVVLLSAITG
jgi:DEAD/DEAH box helicase domain-containing protein